MVKYIYEKYNSIATNTYTDSASWVSDIDAYEPFAGKYKSFTFNSTNNTYSGSGGVLSNNDYVSSGFIAYAASGASVVRYTASGNNTASTPITAKIAKKNSASNTFTTKYTKGSTLVGTVSAEDGTYPNNGRYAGDGYWYVKKGLANSAPIVTLNTADSQTLYENSTYTIAGQALDTDNGNVVNVKYSIDGVVTKALVASVSNGTTPLTFNKQLTFKNGKLFDGESALTGDLTEGTAHQLKVWAEDDQGGKSAEQIRNFYVVPNRVPALSIDQVTPSGIIDSDKFTITGSCSDPDGNEVAVAYKINGGLSKEIYRGKDSAWNFEVSLKELVVGENAIVVEVTDSYNFKTSKTIKLNKNEVKTPILQSVARYKITPPKSTAKGVLLWIQRDIGLSIDAEISMTLNNEQEQYIAMSKTNTAPINSSIEEDEFTYEASEEKENIIVKLKLTRESTDVSDAITLISGVLS